MLFSIILGLVVGLLGGFFMKASFGGSTIIGFIVCVVVGLVGSSSETRLGARSKSGAASCSSCWTSLARAS
ncbi:MAG: hypothetical protein IJ673_11300 [Treponema sp.]|nr:hypothetical protein [Treponema sp.]